VKRRQKLAGEKERRYTVEDANRLKGKAREQGRSGMTDRRGGERKRLQEEVRRAREEVQELEAARLRLSSDVAKGHPRALNEDRRLERRLRDLARWIMRAEREEDEQRAATERQGEELREAWRQHHPQEEREESRPKKGRPS
jgi:seryl-tRNA synthetase